MFQEEEEQRERKASMNDELWFAKTEYQIRISAAFQEGVSHEQKVEIPRGKFQSLDFIKKRNKNEEHDRFDLTFIWYKCPLEMQGPDGWEINPVPGVNLQHLAPGDVVHPTRFSITEQVLSEYTDSPYITLETIKRGSAARFYCLKKAEEIPKAGCSSSDVRNLVPIGIITVYVSAVNEQRFVLEGDKIRVTAPIPAPLTGPAPSIEDELNEDVFEVTPYEYKWTMYKYVNETVVNRLLVTLNKELQSLQTYLVGGNIRARAPWLRLPTEREHVSLCLLGLQLNKAGIIIFPADWQEGKDESDKQLTELGVTSLSSATPEIIYTNLTQIYQALYKGYSVFLEDAGTDELDLFIMELLEDVLMHLSQDDSIVKTMNSSGGRSRTVMINSANVMMHDGLYKCYRLLPLSPSDTDYFIRQKIKTLTPGYGMSWAVVSQTEVHVLSVELTREGEGGGGEEEDGSHYIPQYSPLTTSFYDPIKVTLLTIPSISDPEYKTKPIPLTLKNLPDRFSSRKPTSKIAWTFELIAHTDRYNMTTIIQQNLDQDLSFLSRLLRSLSTTLTASDCPRYPFGYKADIDIDDFINLDENTPRDVNITEDFVLKLTPDTFEQANKTLVEAFTGLMNEIHNKGNETIGFSEEAVKKIVNLISQSPNHRMRPCSIIATAFLEDPTNIGAPIKEERVQGEISYTKPSTLTRGILSEELKHLIQSRSMLHILNSQELLSKSNLDHAENEIRHILSTMPNTIKNARDELKPLEVPDPDQPRPSISLEESDDAIIELNFKQGRYWDAVNQERDRQIVLTDIINLKKLLFEETYIAGEQEYITQRAQFSSSHRPVLGMFVFQLGVESSLTLEQQQKQAIEKRIENTEESVYLKSIQMKSIGIIKFNHQTYDNLIAHLILNRNLAARYVDHILRRNKLDVNPKTGKHNVRGNLIHITRRLREILSAAWASPLQLKQKLRMVPLYYGSIKSPRNNAGLDALWIVSSSAKSEKARGIIGGRKTVKINPVNSGEGVALFNNDGVFSHLTMDGVDWLLMCFNKYSQYLDQDSDQKLPVFTQQEVSDFLEDSTTNGRAFQGLVEKVQREKEEQEKENALKDIRVLIKTLSDLASITNTLGDPDLIETPLREFCNIITSPRTTVKGGGVSKDRLGQAAYRRRIATLFIGKLGRLRAIMGAHEFITSEPIGYSETYVQATRNLYLEDTQENIREELRPLAFNYDSYITQATINSIDEIIGKILGGSIKNRLSESDVLFLKAFFQAPIPPKSYIGDDETEYTIEPFAPVMRIAPASEAPDERPEPHPTLHRVPVPPSPARTILDEEPLLEDDDAEEEDSEASKQRMETLDFMNKPEDFGDIEDRERREGGGGGGDSDDRTEEIPEDDGYVEPHTMNDPEYGGNSRAPTRHVSEVEDGELVVDIASLAIDEAKRTASAIIENPLDQDLVKELISVNTAISPPPPPPPPPMSPALSSSSSSFSSSSPDITLPDWFYEKDQEKILMGYVKRQMVTSWKGFVKDYNNLKTLLEDNKQRTFDMRDYLGHQDPGAIDALIGHLQAKYMLGLEQIKVVFELAFPSNEFGGFYDLSASNLERMRATHEIILVVKLVYSNSLKEDGTFLNQREDLKKVVKESTEAVFKKIIKEMEDDAAPFFTIEENKNYPIRDVDGKSRDLHASVIAIIKAQENDIHEWDKVPETPTRDPAEVAKRDAMKTKIMWNKFRDLLSCDSVLTSLLQKADQLRKFAPLNAGLKKQLDIIRMADSIIAEGRRLKTILDGLLKFRSDKAKKTRENMYANIMRQIGPNTMGKGMNALGFSNALRDFCYAEFATQQQKNTIGLVYTAAVTAQSDVEQLNKRMIELSALSKSLLTSPFPAPPTATTMPQLTEEQKAERRALVSSINKFTTEYETLLNEYQVSKYVSESTQRERQKLQDQMNALVRVILAPEKTLEELKTNSILIKHNLINVIWRENSVQNSLVKSYQQSKEILDKFKQQFENITAESFVNGKFLYLVTLLLENGKDRVVTLITDLIKKRISQALDIPSWSKPSDMPDTQAAQNLDQDLSKRSQLSIKLFERVDKEIKDILVEISEARERIIRQSISLFIETKSVSFKDSDQDVTVDALKKDLTETMPQSITEALKDTDIPDSNADLWMRLLALLNELTEASHKHLLPWIAGPYIGNTQISVQAGPRDCGVCALETFCYFTEKDRITTRYLYSLAESLGVKNGDGADAASRRTATELMYREFLEFWENNSKTIEKGILPVGSIASTIVPVDLRKFDQAKINRLISMLRGFIAKKFPANVKPLNIDSWGPELNTLCEVTRRVLIDSFILQRRSTYKKAIYPLIKTLLENADAVKDNVNLKAALAHSLLIHYERMLFDVSSPSAESSLLGAMRPNTQEIDISFKDPTVLQRNALTDELKRLVRINPNTNYINPIPDSVLNAYVDGFVSHRRDLFDYIRETSLTKIADFMAVVFPALQGHGVEIDGTEKDFLASEAVNVFGPEAGNIYTTIVHQKIDHPRRAYSTNAWDVSERFIHHSLSLLNILPKQYQSSSPSSSSSSSGLITLDHLVRYFGPLPTVDDPNRSRQDWLNAVTKFITCNSNRMLIINGSTSWSVLVRVGEGDIWAIRDPTDDYGLQILGSFASASPVLKNVPNPESTSNFSQVLINDWNTFLNERTSVVNSSERPYPSFLNNGSLAFDILQEFDTLIATEKLDDGQNVFIARAQGIVRSLSQVSPPLPPIIPSAPASPMSPIPESEIMQILKKNQSEIREFEASTALPPMLLNASQANSEALSLLEKLHDGRTLLQQQISEWNALIRLFHTSLDQALLSYRTSLPSQQALVAVKMLDSMTTNLDIQTKQIRSALQSGLEITEKYEEIRNKARNEQQSISPDKLQEVEKILSEDSRVPRENNPPLIHLNSLLLESREKQRTIQGSMDKWIKAAVISVERRLEITAPIKEANNILTQRLQQGSSLISALGN